MNFLTDDVLAACFRDLPEPFDSHAVIQEAMRRFPQPYVRELYGNVQQTDPIQQTHAQIGRALAAHPGLEKVTRASSMNVRGSENDNQVWRRRS
jgi:lipopolysaccharide biosynthesis regulator YciM